MANRLGCGLLVLTMLGHAAAADTLRGHVRAKDHAPLVGATVLASGPEVEGTESALTDEDGAYTIELPTGTYVVTVYYGEHQIERRDVQVGPGAAAEVDLEVDASSEGEVIVVDPEPQPAQPAPAKAHGCAHCASGGGDAPAGAALLVVAALLRPRARRARPSRPGRPPPR